MNAQTLINNIYGQVIIPLITLAFAIAVLVFLWGVVKFIKNGANPDERKVGGRHILWGLVGMAVMISAVVIVKVITSTAHSF